VPSCTASCTLPDWHHRTLAEALADTVLQQDIEELRSALATLEVQLARGLTPHENLRDLQNAVDGLRSSLWIVMQQHCDEGKPALLSKMRVRRATETCAEVLTDVEAGTVTTETTGFAVFHSTLRELADILTSRSP